MAALRPTPVAIHDDGEVLRKALGIQFVEIFRFVAVRGLQKFARFHRQWLDGTARQNRAGDTH
jgi:hypothetical protein